MQLRNQNENGIGLVEVIAALGISVVVITALVSLSLFTLRSSLESKLLLEGTKVANREMELLRAFRDGADMWVDSASFPNDPTVSTHEFLNEIYPCTQEDPCHINTATFSVSETIGTSGSGAEVIDWWFYVTKIDGTELSPADAGLEEIRVTVEATWTVGGQAKFSRLYTDLTNWQSD